MLTNFEIQLKDLSLVAQRPWATRTLPFSGRNAEGAPRPVKGGGGARGGGDLSWVHRILTTVSALPKALGDLGLDQRL